MHAWSSDLRTAPQHGEQWGAGARRRGLLDALEGVADQPMLGEGWTERAGRSTQRKCRKGGRQRDWSVVSSNGRQASDRASIPGVACSNLNRDPCCNSKSHPQRDEGEQEVEGKGEGRREQQQQ